jgi:hypothetical protein
MPKQKQPFHEAFSMTLRALQTRESRIKLMFLTPKGQPRDKTSLKQRAAPAETACKDRG